MLQKLRYRAVHFMINRELARNQRQKQAFSLSQSKNVGILFSLDNEEMYRRINRLIYQLTEEKKQVEAIGYLPGKTVPNYYLAKLRIDLISQKKLNLLGFPPKEAIRDFVARPFDLLLDLTMEECLATDYIAALSKAHFKTGRYRDDMVKVFDFMIKMPEDGGFVDYFESLLEYLGSLNTIKS